MTGGSGQRGQPSESQQHAWAKREGDDAGIPPAPVSPGPCWEHPQKMRRSSAFLGLSPCLLTVSACGAAAMTASRPLSVVTPHLPPDCDQALPSSPPGVGCSLGSDCTGLPAPGPGGAPEPHRWGPGLLHLPSPREQLPSEALASLTYPDGVSKPICTYSHRGASLSAHSNNHTLCYSVSDLEPR